MAGMTQKYEVEFDDGTVVEVAVDGRDLMHHEEVTGGSALDLLTNRRNVGTWYASTFAAMHRQGLFTGTVDEFRERVVFVLPVSADPTPATTPEEVSVS